MSSGLYRKLAFTNIKNNKRFYFPYLLTGILTVVMFYIIFALTGNEGLGKMPGSRDVQMIMGFGKGVIGFFSVIFLFYTNSFLMKRRKKELGIYNILGMEKRHISRILAYETLFTAVIVIGGGLVTGILFNKLMNMLLYKLMGYSTGIDFYISKEGILWSVVLFVGIYILTFIYDLLQVKLANPIELLQGDSAGEREPKTKMLMAVLGCICLGIGYGIAITTKNPIEAFAMFFVAVILVIIGTYLIFTAGSIALLKMLRRKKSYYYQTRHFTSVSGMIYRMKQNAVGLANICILSTMVLVVISSTVCLYWGEEDMLKERYPMDISMYGDAREILEDDQVMEVVKQTAVECGRKIRGKQEYVQLSFSAIEQNGKYLLDNEQLESISGMNEAVGFTVLTREGYETIYHEEIPELKDNELEILTFQKSEEQNQNQIVIGDCEFQVRDTKQVEDDNGDDMVGIMDQYFYLVVNDNEDLERFFRIQEEAYQENASLIRHYYQLDLDGSEEEKKACFEKIEERLTQISSSFENGILCWSRQTQRESYRVMFGGFFFLGLFLGAMFLMITVLIIFYKQISEGYEDKNRFAIMEKVGMSREEVKATIRSQVRTVFLLPIIMASIHVAAAFPMIRRLLTMFGFSNTMLFVGCVVGTILVFLVIYLLVFMQTSRIYYKIVGEQV